MEYREVLGCTGELVKEKYELYHWAGKGVLSAHEHERLGQSGTRRRRGIPVVALQPAYGVPKRSGTRPLGSAPRTGHMARWKRRQARSPVGDRACGHCKR
jgi:hypothetical protein